MYFISPLQRLKKAQGLLWYKKQRRGNFSRKARLAPSQRLSPEHSAVATIKTISMYVSFAQLSLSAHIEKTSNLIFGPVFVWNFNLFATSRIFWVTDCRTCPPSPLTPVSEDFFPPHAEHRSPHDYCYYYSAVGTGTLASTVTKGRQSTRHEILSFVQRYL